MISDMRAKYGKDSVNLEYCGKFTLAEDLSDISDITRIDLGEINSLEGEPLEKFPGVFFAHQSARFGIFLTLHLPFTFYLLNNYHGEKVTLRPSRAARI